MTDLICSKCDVVVDNDLLRCSLCPRTFHGIKCAGFNKTILKAITENKAITWKCDDCINTCIVKMDVLETILSTLQEHSVLIAKLTEKSPAPVPPHTLNLNKKGGKNKSARPLTPINEVPPDNFNFNVEPLASASTNSAQKDAVKLTYAKVANSSNGKSTTRTPLVIGNKSDSIGSAFSSAERRQWIFLGRVKPNATESDIESYVKDTLDIADVKCVKIVGNDDIASFKIGVKESLVKGLLDPNLWPTGVAVKEFLPRNPRRYAPQRGDFRQRPVTSNRS